jgi:hypothetical protein
MELTNGKCDQNGGLVTSVWMSSFFEATSATFSDAVCSNGNGGGVYIEQFMNVRLTKCQFKNLSALEGGGRSDFAD